MDNNNQLTKPDKTTQRKISIFSKTPDIKTLILILFFTNLITGSVLYFVGYSSKTEGIQSLPVLVEDEKDEIKQLKKKVAE